MLFIAPEAVFLSTRVVVMGFHIGAFLLPAPSMSFAAAVMLGTIMAVGVISSPAVEQMISARKVLFVQAVQRALPSLAGQLIAVVKNGSMVLMIAIFQIRIGISWVAGRPALGGAHG